MKPNRWTPRHNIGDIVRDKKTGEKFRIYRSGGFSSAGQLWDCERLDGRWKGHLTFRFDKDLRLLRRPKRKDRQI